MFADLKATFDNTWKQYEDFSTETKQNHSVISNKLNEINVATDNINQNNLTIFNNNVKKERLIEEQIEKQTDAIRSEVSLALEQVL